MQCIYEGRSISNAPDPLPIAVEQRNLAQLLVFFYIGTIQSYAFLPSFDAALETVFVEHPRLVLQPRCDFKNQGCIIWETLSFQKQLHGGEEVKVRGCKVRRVGGWGSSS